VLAAILVAAAAAAQAPPGPTPAAARVRVALDASLWPAARTFGESRTLTEYAEEATIHSSYEAEAGLGPELGVEVSLFRRVSVLVGYSHATRDLSGQVDVSRPHPLYLDRPRTASAAITGYGLSEDAVHLDLAYGGTRGPLDWAVFSGATVFRVEAELLDAPTYVEEYPYDELAILSTPSVTAEESAIGWNVGGRLDYRLGRSRRFGLGVQVRYSEASVTLQARPGTAGATLEAGGLSVGAGIRVYF
jgi:hypothetical protein